MDTLARVAELRLADCAHPGAAQERLAALPGGDAVRVVLVQIDGGKPGHDSAVAEAFAACPLPLVAVLSGRLTGEVLDAALQTDIRIAAEGTALRQGPSPSARWSLLTRGVPGGMTWSAEAAFHAGLVTALAATAEGALAEGRRIASVIASRGPHATRLAKEAVWRGLPQSFEQALRFETDLTLLLQTTKDRAEGVSAFLQKRSPEFEGK